MPNQSIYDIREDEINIDGKSWLDSDVQQLAYKSIYVTQKMTDYWRDDLERGDHLFKTYEGQILSDMQRATYEEVEDKVVIEPPIMKSPIRALLGQIIKARKSGTIVTESGDIDKPFAEVNETKTINIVLKDMEKKTREQIKVRDAIHDSLVSCYPNALLWKKKKPTEENPLKYELYHLPWNSCIFGPLNFRQPDCSDINELCYYDLRSMADLIENFPEQESNLIAHWGRNKVDDKMISSVMHWDINDSITDINYLKGVIDAVLTNMRGPGGLVPVFERLFPIKRKEDVYIRTDLDTTADEDDETGTDYFVLPESWSDKRKKEWVEKNKDNYQGPFERPIVTLWRTVFTMSGLVLFNGKHWYQQCGRLPMTVVVPAMMNGRPTGPAVDMTDDVLRNCVAQIEYLDDMRKGGGQLLVTKAGYLTKESAENITEEANKSLGVVFLSKDAPGPVGDGYRIERRDPSTAWRDYGEFAKNSMEEITRLNETMQGNVAPRQAAIAKTAEINQAMTVSMLYVDNFNMAWENNQNLKLSMIPYIYDDSMIQISGYDEESQEDRVQMVNVPNYNPVTGEKESVVNDVTSKKYRWKVSPVDDSPTAKANMMQDALMIINGAFGPLMQADPSGNFFAEFLSALENPILNKAGKKLLETAKNNAQSQQQAEAAKAQQENQIDMMKAQAELERAKKAGVNLSFTGTDMAQYPNLVQLYMLLSGKGKELQQETQQPQQPMQDMMVPQQNMGGQTPPQNDMMMSAQPQTELAGTPA